MVKTVEKWAFEFVSATTLSGKLRPGIPPSEWSGEGAEISAPGRPPELVQREEKRRKTPKNLREIGNRADVLHTFLHHELQAAELMAWAILKFPTTPLGFRRGLLGIAQDEIRHLNLYAEHLEKLGHPYGSFPVNDWFWRRVPCATPIEFVARMAIGFEGGNLDHGARFTKTFAEAGDARAAEIQAQITEEEISHAAFGLHWFREFTGGVDFDQWRALLPGPVTPAMTKGSVMNLEARRRAGFSDEFLSALEKW